MVWNYKQMWNCKQKGTLFSPSCFLVMIFYHSTRNAHHDRWFACICVSVHHVHAWCLKRPKEGTRFPKSRRHLSAVLVICIPAWLSPGVPSPLSSLEFHALALYRLTCVSLLVGHPRSFLVQGIWKFLIPREITCVRATLASATLYCSAENSRRK